MRPWRLCGKGEIIKADFPTPHPDVNAILHELLAHVRAILGEQFVGLYLYGSLAAGDFNPRRSDVDFVVATAVSLPNDTIAALKTMHPQLRASNLSWARRIEGDYVPLSALRRYDPDNNRYPHLGSDGHFAVEDHDSDTIIQRYQLREQGVVVAGPPPHTLIDPVTPDELRRATLETLHGWWAPMLDDRSRLNYSGYQIYAIFTMCRALYTLHHGTIASKTAAARWAQQSLNRWSPLIEEALAWTNGTPADNLQETIGFIRYTLARSEENF